MTKQKFHDKFRKNQKTHFYSFQCVFELPVRFKNVFLDPVWGIDVHKILPENLSRYQDKVFKKTQNTLFICFFKFYELQFTLSKFRPGGSILLRKLPIWPSSAANRTQKICRHTPLNIIYKVNNGYLLIKMFLNEIKAFNNKVFLSYVPSYTGILLN